MAMHKSARNDVTAGQHVNHDYRTQAEAVVNLPEVTLADYLNNRDKLYEEKMSFDEWFNLRYKNQNWLHKDLKNSMYRALQECWNAAKENK